MATSGEEYTNYRPRRSLWQNNLRTAAFRSNRSLMIEWLSSNTTVLDEVCNMLSSYELNHFKFDYLIFNKICNPLLRGSPGERYRDSELLQKETVVLISLVFWVCLCSHQLSLLTLVLTPTNSAWISLTTSFTHLFITRFCRSIGLWIPVEYY